MPDIEYVEGGAELLDDVEPLWEKLNRYHIATSTYFSRRFTGFSFQLRRAMLLEKARDGVVRVDMAKDNESDRYVGYCLSTIVDTLRGREGEIESIFVEPECRDHGIGGEMMRKVPAWMEQNNVDVKWLVVGVGNERVFSFYERFGFCPKSTKLEQL